MIKCQDTKAISTLYACKELLEFKIKKNTIHSFTNMHIHEDKYLGIN